MALEEDMRLMR